MTKPPFMIAACLPFVVAVGAGCRAASDAVDDAITVDVGAGTLQAVEMDNSIVLEGARIPDCLDFNATIPLTNTSVTLVNTDRGCTLTVQQPDLMLLDEHAIERAREDAGDFDVDGIRGCTLDLQTLDLSTADHAPLPLSQYIDAITLSVDGDPLLDHTAASELQADGGLPVELPPKLIQKLKTSVKANQPARADVGISLWLRTPSQLPETVNLRVILQPILKVNVVDTVL